MSGMDEQRSPDRSATDDVLERAVRAVVTPHVADLNQSASRGDLRIEDAQTRLLSRGQRLLAEHWLASVDGREDVFLVRGSPGAHHDGVDVVIVDDVFSCRVDARAVDAVGDLMRARRIDVGDGSDRSAGQNPGQSPNVVLSDHPDADDSNA